MKIHQENVFFFNFHANNHITIGLKAFKELTFFYLHFMLLCEHLLRNLSTLKYDEVSHI